MSTKYVIKTNGREVRCGEKDKNGKWIDKRLIFDSMAAAELHILELHWVGIEEAECTVEPVRIDDD